ncbi:CdaR family protein [Streptococcus dentiloxodontae]
MLKRFLSRFKRPTFWQICVSFFFAVILFITAATSNYSLRDNVSSSTETYTQTLESVPIDIKYDSDAYFISGYNYGAEVYLTATTQLALATETSLDTRNFKLVADLTNFGPGTSKVAIKVKDLPAGMSAQVYPATMTVTIGKKASKTFAVEPKISDDQLEKGYSITSAKLNLDKVTVTSSEDIIDQIDHVEAVLPDNTILNGDYDGEMTLQAVSESGTVLASSISPAKATAAIKVKKLTKKVPLKVELVGDMDSSLSKINYEIDTSQVTISGTQEELDAISSVTATVDISAITKDTTKTVTLSAKDVSVEPETVKVNLKTTKK